MADKVPKGETASGKSLSIAFLFFMSVFLLAVNYHTPLIGEDFALSPVKAAHQSDSFKEKIRLIVDKIMLQSAHWNARLGEQLAIFFLGFHKGYFNLLNSFVAAAYFYTIFLYAFGRFADFRRRRDIYPFIISFALVIFLMPAFGEIYFWTTGACNYLWACELILLFGLPYRLLLSGKDILSGRRTLLPLFCLLGFFAGMSSENSAVVFGVLILAIILYFIVNKRRLSAWIYCGGISLSAGILYLYFSPSTKIRLDYYNKAHGVGEVTFSRYILRAWDVAKDFVWSNKYLIGLFTVLLLSYFFQRKRDLTSKLRSSSEYGENENNGPEEVFVVLFLLTLTCISLAILGVAPYHEQRSFLLTVTMLIVAIVRLFNDMTRRSSSLGKKSTHFILLLIFSLTILKSFLIYEKYVFFHNEATIRDVRIKQLAQEKVREIKVTPFLTRTRRELNTGEGYVIGNVQYFMYYGVDNIRIEY